MKLVRRAGTHPELAVRAALSALGIRYRTCVASLPGSPDVANRRRRFAIFVHGCFWHGHHGCRLFTVPKTNTTFWREKVVANRRRDRRKAEALRRLGFRVITVWQCETRTPAKLERRLERLLAR
jgi:DNA mismatch endonuclease (patch repair protein)